MSTFEKLFYEQHAERFYNTWYQVIDEKGFTFVARQRKSLVVDIAIPAKIIVPGIFEDYGFDHIVIHKNGKKERQKNHIQAIDGFDPASIAKNNAQAHGAKEITVVYS